jgi:methylphosphotriester-DNA--protein-cysteine methyltransferase
VGYRSKKDFYKHFVELMETTPGRLTQLGNGARGNR